jgi:hypothetical protein
MLQDNSPEIHIANTWRKVYHALMDEGRKRVMLIAAAILAARKLSNFEGGKRVPATMTAISDAVRWAEELLKAIDERWPASR